MILQGNGDGTFQPAVSYMTQDSAYALGIGDFNGDGAPDLAVVDNGGTVSLLLNTCVPSPRLRAKHADSSVILSWPCPSTGFQLESSPNLLLPNWQAAGEAAVTNGGAFQVSLSLTNLEQRYFRLRKP